MRGLPCFCTHPGMFLEHALLYKMKKLTQFFVPLYKRSRYEVTLELAVSNGWMDVAEDMLKLFVPPQYCFDWDNKYDAIKLYFKYADNYDEGVDRVSCENLFRLWEDKIFTSKRLLNAFDSRYTRTPEAEEWSKKYTNWNYCRVHIECHIDKHCDIYTLYDPLEVAKSFDRGDMNISNREILNIVKRWLFSAPQLQIKYRVFYVLSQMPDVGREAQIQILMQSEKVCRSAADKYICAYNKYASSRYNPIVRDDTSWGFHKQLFLSQPLDPISPQHPPPYQKMGLGSFADLPF